MHFSERMYKWRGEVSPFVLSAFTKREKNEKKIIIIN